MIKLASDVQETSPPYRQWGMGVFRSWGISKDVFLVKYSRFGFVYVGLVRLFVLNVLASLVFFPSNPGLGC
jgi:hypothetical protein